jgi:hypothetical protein
MPHIFAQLPYPKASLAVLKAFTEMAVVELDLTELAKEAKEMQEKLSELLEQMQQAIGQTDPDEEEPAPSEPVEEAEAEQPSLEDRDRIEQLFEHAKRDRSTAYELKRELDRLDVYREYEDRFLDLFKKPG